MFAWRKRAVAAAFAALVIAGLGAGIWIASRTSGSLAPGNLPVIADRLPAQLSNSEFWQMVEDFSEPDGYFRSDNFLSNEAGLQTVIPRIKDRVQPGGVYIGVGPEQNFTYIVSLEPKLSFIVDIRRLNMLEHLLYKAVFELSTDRADFVSRMFSRERPAKLKEGATVEAIFDAYENRSPDRNLFDRNLNEVFTQLLQYHQFPISHGDMEQIRYVYDAFFRSGPDLTYTFRDTYYQGTLGMPKYRELMEDTDDVQPLPHNWGFLATEDRFRRIQDIQRKNLIVPLVGDFAGPRTLRAVGRYLKDHDAFLSLFYTSNVELYLFQQHDDWRRFYENVGTLPTTSASTFIRFSANRSAFFDDTNGGAFDRRSQLWSPVQEVVAAVRERKINDYAGVIQMSQ